MRDFPRKRLWSVVAESLSTGQLSAVRHEPISSSVIGDEA
jgi:hypothetical protein